MNDVITFKTQDYCLRICGEDVSLFYIDEDGDSIYLPVPCLQDILKAYHHSDRTKD